jgi:hypothetical protein
MFATNEYLAARAIQNSITIQLRSLCTRVSLQYQLLMLQIVHIHVHIACTVLYPYQKVKLTNSMYTALLPPYQNLSCISLRG